MWPSLQELDVLHIGGVGSKKFAYATLSMSGVREIRKYLAHARALNPCAKPSRLPSSPDGPPSLLMPPSPPLPQACYARTHHPTTTWMASSHHVANSSPTCHESPLPPAEPQPPLKEHGLDLATPPPLAWRLTSKTVASLPGDWSVQQSFRCLCLETAQYNSPRPRSCGQLLFTEKTILLQKWKANTANRSGYWVTMCLILAWLASKM